MNPSWIRYPFFQDQRFTTPYKNQLNLLHKFNIDFTIGSTPRRHNEDKGKVKKKIWTPEEDNLLRMLVAENGARDWSTIAEKLANRGGKQCRQRWHNHLRDGVIKKGWTPNEEWLLILGVLAYGTKWSTISKYLPGRPDNTIKNHWNCKMRNKKGELVERVEALLQNADQLELLSVHEKELLGILKAKERGEVIAEVNSEKIEVGEGCKKALIEFYQVQAEFQLDESY